MGKVHKDEARARMTSDEPGRIEEVRTDDDSAAEMHLYRDIVIGGETAEPVHDKDAEGHLCRGVGRRLALG